jgi:hypothetical protein
MLYGGIIVAKNLDEKVINLFSNHNSNCVTPEVQQKVKFYAGFNYVKLKKDTNGNKFNKENLLKYSEKCHYMVTVMRELDGEVVLYSYDVPNSELFKFMKSFEENTLDGTIIEIEKYFPEGLA